MKTIVVFLIAIFSVFAAESQTLTESYLKKIPALPKDSCNITREAMEAFQQKVADLKTQIDSEIESLKEAANNKGAVNEEAAKEHAMQQMSQQYGLSPEQMAQMKAGKMSAADKQALANQVLQQQTNMSMSEVQNLSKMSDAGRKAYAEALGAEMMANSEAVNTQQSGNNNAKTLNQLMVEQQAMLNKITTEGRRIGNLYASIESDPDLQKSLQNIDKWHNKMMSMTGINYGQGKQIDSLSNLIKTTQIKICQNYTPRYRSALRQHQASMKASIPDIYQLGQLTAQLTKLQTSIEPPAESIETGCLESILGYLGNLEDAYKFKLYFPEEN